METTFKTIYKDVINKLDSYLPSHLTYHSTEHTKYVVKLSEYIGNKVGLNERELFLVKVAALYHDLGFIIGPEDHEEKSCTLAIKDLPDYNIDQEEIEKICGMIMATKIPQVPTNIYEKVLADADLEYLSTDSFERISNLLYKELQHFNDDLTLDKWNEIQIAFIANHEYHTRYCKQNRENKKQENLQNLINLSK
ncbi:HD domain-containing protein [Portibacter marinus]|uniref:HD domain-containing protein n=1 Tax=Portibacter marinus TaxID=2898660 RepID=UPI001F1F324B|nr:HD domain-containing protein [Portibacter marinus]